MSEEIFTEKKNNIPVPWAVRAPASLRNFYLKLKKNINPKLSKNLKLFPFRKF